MGTDTYGDLLLPSGGYRSLKSFQLAQLIYDITVRFVELYIPAESRTCDQMVQAARSGVQNIAEGSVDAASYFLKRQIKKKGAAAQQHQVLRTAPIVLLFYQRKSFARAGMPISSQ